MPYYGTVERMRPPHRCANALPYKSPALSGKLKNKTPAENSLGNLQPESSVYLDRLILNALGVTP